MHGTGGGRQRPTKSPQQAEPGNSAEAELTGLELLPAQRLEVMLGNLADLCRYSAALSCTLPRQRPPGICREISIGCSSGPAATQHRLQVGNENACERRRKQDRLADKHIKSPSPTNSPPTHQQTGRAMAYQSQQFLTRYCSIFVVCNAKNGCTDSSKWASECSSLFASVIESTSAWRREACWLAVFFSSASLRCRVVNQPNVSYKQFDSDA